MNSVGVLFIVSIVLVFGMMGFKLMLAHSGSVKSVMMPENVPSGTIRITSLDDLIRAAVDMNERVIFDEEKDLYFFIHNSIAYTFSLSGEQES